MPKGAFEFIKQLQQEEPVFLTGAFLHPVNFEILVPAAFAMTTIPAIEMMEEDQTQFKQSIREFRDRCERNAIEYTVHEESDQWGMEDLSKETRFADLMVMSEELFCTNINTNEPNAFMQEAIHKAECPVMLLPESYKPFNRMIIAYAGKKESMFAVKEFCNLFPAFTNMETKIVYAKNEDNDEIPDMNLLEEFAGRHFSNLTIQKDYFNPKMHFNIWPNEYRNALIICGSFGRGGFSNLIKKSFAENTIQEHSNPLFIAHL